MSLDTVKRNIQTALDSMNAAMADVVALEVPLAKVTRVPKGGNLQAAVDAAVPGELLRVYPGEYPQLVLTPKPAGAAIVMTPDTADLPPGRRIDPTYKPGLITLRSNDGLSPLRTVKAASNYILRGLNPTFTLDGGPPYAAIGDYERTETDPTRLPANIVFDQCLLQGDPIKGAKIGIVMNCGNVSVLNSHLSDFFRFGQDNQTAAATSGPGPFTLVNDYLEASGENLIFGGADNAAAAMNPHNLIVRGCTLTKPIAWQARSPRPTVKNGFELKNMVTALIEDCLIENCWTDAQTGTIILFTVRSQDGTNPWAQVANVTFQNNVVRHAPAGLSMIGRDNLNPSQRTTNIKILNNLFYDIDPKKFVGSGFMFQIYNGVADVEIAHNTCLSVPANEVGAFMSVGAEQSNPNTPEKNERLNVHDNVFMECAYGLIGNATGVGKASWDAFCLNSAFERNLIAIGASGRNITYPGVNNYKGDVADEVPVGPDFKLLPKYAGLASADGTPIGADVDKIRAGVAF